MHRTTRSAAILVAAMALSAAPAFATEPPADIAFDGVVTVVFHDPEYDNGNGIEGADVTLLVVDVAADTVVQEQFGTTGADGAAVFSEVARPIDPSLDLQLQASAVRDETFVDPEGCTDGELLAGDATAPAGLEVTIDVEVVVQHNERTCPPSEAPPVIVEGNAIDPTDEPLAIVHGEALIHWVHGTDGAPISTSPNGSFRVEVPATTSAEIERRLEVTLVGPDVRTVEDEEGCLITWALVARGTWTLVGNQAPEPTTLVAAEEPMQGICGETASPDPPGAPNAPSITLPPTDTIGRSSAGAGGGIAAALVLLLAIGLAATVAADRRVSRRGS